LKVAILVFPGVEELDFVGFLEVLSVANRAVGRGHFKTELVGTKGGTITCSGGMRVVPDRALAELGVHDLMFVPGGGANRGTGVDLLMKDEGVLESLRESYENGNRVWSVCTGALVLGRAGLLKGKRATTHHAHLGEVRRFGAEASRIRTVTDGRVTTGGGISSSIDVGLALVEEELGKAVRQRVGESMEYPPPG